KDAKPAPKAEAKPGANPGGDSALKYELERARCDGGVTVHQDPTDPTPPPGGIAPRRMDITCQTLHVDQSPQGSVMTVVGTDEKPGEVHYDTVTIIGPKVKIDQVLNETTVDGRGTLVMPAGSDLSGTDLKTPEVVTVHWRDSMVFNGSRKFAVFVGKVNATQGESWVVCHTMRVVLDRP